MVANLRRYFSSITIRKPRVLRQRKHLVEGALYARDREGMVRLHFTVSPEHRKEFEALIHSIQPIYEDLYGVRYDISFSEQLPSTDTLALTPDGELFRTDTGHLLFRPGGHGALIHNLGKLPTDVVFIKNIDNVVPDPYKGTTIMYKKVPRRRTHRTETTDLQLPHPLGKGQALTRTDRGNPRLP